jgi:hypothetical protein
MKKLQGKPWSIGIKNGGILQKGRKLRNYQCNTSAVVVLMRLI